MNKVLLLIALIVTSVIGFMVKLPKPLRGFGFELHAAFYCLASIFLLILFPKRHFLVLIGLIFFGIIIEVFQHASNYILDKRIHGNFDPIDIQYNLIGVFLVFIPFYLIKILRKLII
jgi:hypothetical protein